MQNWKYDGMDLSHLLERLIIRIKKLHPTTAEFLTDPLLQQLFVDTIEEIGNAGYEIYKKGQVEQVEERSSVETHLRLGASEGQVEGNRDQGGERGYQERVLTLEEVRKLRKHMAMWPR